MAKYYLVKLGGRLYVASRFYNLFQDTTSKIESAYRFNTFEEAAKVCRKTINGKIEEYDIEDNSDLKNENIELRDIIRKQQDEIEELKRIIKNEESANNDK